MSWKMFAIGAAFSAMPTTAAPEQKDHAPDDKEAAPETEYVENSRAELKFSLEKTWADACREMELQYEKEVADSLKRSADKQLEQIKARIEAAKAAKKPEQIRRENFEAARFDALTILAMSEGFRAEAYSGAGGPFIGWGCNIKANGTRVRSGSRLKSGKEAKDDTYRAFEQKYYALKKYLPLDKMTKYEIAVFINLAYNHGERVLGSRGEKSDVVKKFLKYKENPSTANKEALRIAYKKTSRNKKRKDFEVRILLGEIKIDNEGISNDPNAVNLAAARIDLNNIKELPESSAELVKILREGNVMKSVNDTMNYPLSYTYKMILKKERQAAQAQTSQQKREALVKTVQNNRDNSR